ncbi:MAG TPA: NAD(P)-dependent alcohol dehydrogenase [Gammaproteobacteria bacterium]
MKAYHVVKGSTDIEGLKQVELEPPEPGPGQVRVRMRAASLNFRDLAIVRGKYIGGAVQRDLVPLSDGAGEVEKVGPGVRGLQAGDRVLATFNQGDPPVALGASPLDGVLAELKVFDERGLLKVPEHLSFEEAATLPCAGVTAWNALAFGKPTRPGETVLTLGTGGVSIFALQLAKLAGARVIITSSSDEKLERAKALGADEGINYVRTPEWADEVLRLTDGRGADHVVETAALGTLPQSYRAVGFGGEIALIGVLTRPAGDLSPQPLMFKGATLRGIFVGHREHAETLLRAVAQNRLRPVVDRVFDFDAVPDAYRYLRDAKHFGKIVVRI